MYIGSILGEGLIPPFVLGGWVGEANIQFCGMVLDFEIRWGWGGGCPMYGVDTLPRTLCSCLLCSSVDDAKKIEIDLWNRRKNAGSSSSFNASGSSFIYHHWFLTAASSASIKLVFGLHILKMEKHVLYLLLLLVFKTSCEKITYFEVSASGFVVIIGTIHE
jgi:hypothetical protein